MGGCFWRTFWQHTHTHARTGSNVSFIHTRSPPLHICVCVCALLHYIQHTFDVRTGAQKNIHNTDARPPPVRQKTGAQPPEPEPEPQQQPTAEHIHWRDLLARGTRAIARSVFYDPLTFAFQSTGPRPRPVRTRVSCGFALAVTVQNVVYVELVYYIAWPVFGIRECVCLKLGVGVVRKRGYHVVCVYVSYLAA